MKIALLVLTGATLSYVLHSAGCRPSRERPDRTATSQERPADAPTTSAPANVAAGPRPSARLAGYSELAETPRARFTPNTRRGYWNADVVGDFTLPASKALIFAGAGRNLHVRQDWGKLFRRGFTAVDLNRMTEEEIDIEYKRRNWRSRLRFEQRSRILYQNSFREAPFFLGWAGNSEQADQTWHRRPSGAPNAQQSVYQAAYELAGGCGLFGDCPPGSQAGFGHVFFDIENDGISAGKRQEQVNLYVTLAKAFKDASPRSVLGSITPVPHNSFGYSRAVDYQGGADWLWNTPARHTATSRQRGMSDDIVGKSFEDYVDVQMPGTYYLYPEFNYGIRHNEDGSRHWLAALLGEQEVNRRLSAKPRMAWQWLFNTQNPDFPNSAKAEHPAPPAVAEGMAIFYWFTGAYGVLFWDDVVNLTPDGPRPSDPAMRGLGSDRPYACYEHYIHGLWRLFKHHGDLFNGRETYLNEQTECSFDGGATWERLNANRLKVRNVPFARAIVNGDQILIAATNPYARPGQNARVQVRYVQNGYRFQTDITLQGDEIYLGRATMPK